jgi:undecaprenyl diphosphate synthase
MPVQEPQSGVSFGRINTTTSPKHVGLIMDGNGRWAQLRGKPRTFGHQEGLKTVKRLVRFASNQGVQFLSLFAFSTENWKRAEEEVSFLMNLIVVYLKQEYDFYRENHIRVVHSGDINGLPAKVQREIRQVSADTAAYDGLTVNLAINYGGRGELIRAFGRAFQAAPGSANAAFAINEAGLRQHLDLPFLPDIDLLIRTSGERRLSNFMLWQSAYAELYFSDKLWPDWDESDFLGALTDYQQRNRRFGGA